MKIIRHLDSVAGLVIVGFAISAALFDEKFIALLWTILAITWINFMYVGYIYDMVKKINRKLDDR